MKIVAKEKEAREEEKKEESGRSRENRSQPGGGEPDRSRADKGGGEPDRSRAGKGGEEPDRNRADKGGAGRREKGRVWSAGRILAPMLGVVLGIAVVVGIGIWNDYRDAIIDTQKQQMLLTVKSLAESMEVFIREYEEDLDGIYRMTATGQEQRKDAILQEYVDTHQTFVEDVILEDAGGTVFVSTKHTRIRQVYSISRISMGKTLRLAELESGEMCLVLRMETEKEGAFSIVLKLEQYYQTLMRGLQVGSNGYMVLKDAKGVILMHPERAQWGIEVIDGRMGMYENLDLESLKTMIDHQKEGREGVDEYYSYWWLEDGYPRVRKISAYCPVQTGEDFLILSAVMDYDDIYIPIAEGVFRLVLLFLAFFLVMVAMAWYIVRMLLQKQKDTEQIAYLTELNRLLEEMHRSEETIAHQQRLQIMGTMTGGIAHEFNNLLTPIMGYADLLLLDLDEDSEQYDNALEIYEASVKAKEIIQQISSLSRKNMETAYKNMNGKRMLTRALKMVRSVCPANVCLEEKIDLENECILCNETQMNQVILNICVNAIHAIGHQEGRIRIISQVVGRDKLDGLDFAGRYLPPDSENWNRYVGITIQDNGCGMSREIMNQIFDPFFTTKKGGKGTGLGLALVEQIVSSHKGGIVVESEPGEGSSFSVYLPVNEQGDADVGTVFGREEPGKKSEGTGTKTGTGTRTEPDEEAESGERLRLLIVDDNPKVLRLLEKDTAKLKISLECRLNFEEARRALESQSGFDALVTEQEICGRSAVDFCMSLQGKYPDMQMIVMADRMTRELAEAKQRRLVDACIDKPVSISSILEALKENLNNL